MNFPQFLAAAHISKVNCDKMAGDRPRQPAYEIFSTINVDFSSPSPNPLSSRKPAHAGVKEGYSPKSGYFTDIGSCSVKTVADGYRHADYIITSTGDGLFFRFINTDDLEQTKPPKMGL